MRQRAETLSRSLNNQISCKELRKFYYDNGFTCTNVSLMDWEGEKDD